MLPRRPQARFPRECGREVGYRERHLRLSRDVDAPYLTRMGKRAMVVSFVALALGCGDDDGFSRREEPASVECPCALDVSLENLALCMSPTTAFGPAHVYSSHLDPASGAPVCEPARNPQPQPAMPWSALRASSQCAGTGQFCVTVWAGEVGGADDCELTRVCSAVAAPGGQQVVDLAALPSWTAASSACAQRYEQEGGYLEFSVDSEQLGCEREDGSKRVVPLCPSRCQTDPSGPNCDSCGNGPILRI